MPLAPLNIKANREPHATGVDRMFGTLPTAAGTYLVIANDNGHEVAERDSLSSANGVALMLNSAAHAGRKELAKALNSLR